MKEGATDVYLEYHVVYLTQGVIDVAHAPSLTRINLGKGETTSASNLHSVAGLSSFVPPPNCMDPSA